MACIDKETNQNKLACQLCISSNTQNYKIYDIDSFLVNIRDLIKVDSPFKDLVQLQQEMAQNQKETIQNLQNTMNYINQEFSRTIESLEELFLQDQNTIDHKMQLERDFEYQIESKQFDQIEQLQYVVNRIKINQDDKFEIIDNDDIAKYIYNRSKKQKT